MSSREVRTDMPVASRRSALTLSNAGFSLRFRVAAIVRPARLDDEMWRTTLARLEELGIFKGQVVEKTGALGPMGAIIVKAGGSRVALSRDISEAIVVR